MRGFLEILINLEQFKKINKIGYVKEILILKNQKNLKKIKKCYKK